VLVQSALGEQLPLLVAHSLVSVHTRLVVYAEVLVPALPVQVAV